MMEALNTHCPWSGGTVSDAALTTYRGQTVGFCETACRDKFEKATKAFDAVIESAATQVVRYASELYRPRRYRFAGLTTLRTARLKTYVIDRTEAELPANEALAAVFRYHDETEGSVVPDGALGHVMVHRGEEGDWLLLHWWTPGGIMAGHLLKSAVGALHFKPFDDPAIACVWEQIVIEHERRAWVRHMMGTTPDHQAFLSDILQDGSY